MFRKSAKTTKSSSIRQIASTRLLKKPHSHDSSWFCRVLKLSFTQPRDTTRTTRFSLRVSIGRTFGDRRANIVIAKLLAVNLHTWVVSWNLSNTFGRVTWDKLWTAFGTIWRLGHLVWIIHCACIGSKLGVWRAICAELWFCNRCRREI